MWSLIDQIGRVPKTLVWDREATIGGAGKLTTLAAVFAGALATRIRLAPARDPEFKGMVERANGYPETSFLPGRKFASPADFNTQLTGWLKLANTRQVRSIGARPVEHVDTDRQGMLPLPRLAPQTDLRFRIRLARDYHVRIDGNDYSADPRHIGKSIDAVATGATVIVTSIGTVIGQHKRSGGHHQVITDPDQATAAQLRTAYYSRRSASPRRHPDGHPVDSRTLGLRHPLRRRFQLLLHPHHNGRSTRTPTATKTTEQISSKIAYLARAEDRHDRTSLGRPQQHGQRRELAPRGIPCRGPGTPTCRPRIRQHHHANPHGALPRDYARDIADELTRKGVSLSLGGSVYDPTDPVGRLLFNVLGMVAEFEADLIRMRTRESMVVAKGAAPRQAAQALRLAASSPARAPRLRQPPQEELAELFSVSRTTIYREAKRRAASASQAPS